MNDFYDSGVEGLLDGSVRWAKDALRVCLVQPSYRFDPSHSTMTDVIQHSIGASETLTGCEVSGRKLLADDTYVLATKPATANQIVVYVHAKDTPSARLVLCTSIRQVKVVAGQRVDVSPADGVLAVFGESRG